MPQTYSSAFTSLLRGLFLLTFGLASGLAVPLAAQTFTVPFTPGWHDNDIGFTRTDYGTSGNTAFHFGIPNYRGTEPPIIRGVVIEYPGSGGTCTTLFTEYHRWLYDNGFATMGQRGSTASYSAAANAITALNSLATTLGRPELANVPLFVFGQSMGGAQSTYVAERYPNRVVGFYANHTGPQAFYSTGPNYDTLPTSTNAALAVPGYFAISDSEDTQWAYWQYKKFQAGRGYGAPWSMLETRATTHTDFARMGKDAVMVFDAMAATRLPAVVDPRTGIVPLNPVTLANGYLLEHRIGEELVTFDTGWPQHFNLWRDFDSTHLEIAPYAQHDRYPDRANMGFALNLKLADFWASRASTGYMTVPTLWHNAGNENALEDFGTKEIGETVYAEVDLNGFTNATSVELYDNGVKLGTVSTIPGNRLVPVTFTLSSFGLHRLRITAVASDGERRLGWTMSIHVRSAPTNGNTRPTAVAVNNEYFKLFQQKADGTYDPQRFHFTVSDAQSSAASLTTSLSIVAAGRGNIKTATLGGSGADRWVDITPKDNWSGRAGGLLVFVGDGTDTTNLNLTFRARPYSLTTPTRRNTYNGFQRLRPLAVTGPLVTELIDDGSDFSATTYQLTTGADTAAAEAVNAPLANAQSYGYGNWYYSRIKMHDTAEPTNIYSSLTLSYSRRISRSGAADLKATDGLMVFSTRPAHAPILNYPANLNASVGIPAQVVLRLDEMSLFRNQIPVTVTSSNHAVLPPSGIATSVRGIDQDRVLSLTPVAPGSTTITITATDDSTPALVTTRTFVLTSSYGSVVLGFSAPTLSQSEGNSGATNATLSVTRSGPATGAVSIDYATADGTAVSGSDYTATSGTLSWADGDSSAKTINVPLLGDTAYEANESFNVTLSNPSNGAVVGTSTATVTITNDDSGPGVLAFSSSTANGAETAGYATLSVSRSEAAGAVSVSYATSNGTATAGSDYIATSGTLFWADGDSSAKTITIPLLNDGLVDAAETFTVTLNTPAGGATLGTPATATVTILDDEVVSSAELISGGNFEGATFSTGSIEAGTTPKNIPLIWDFADQTPLINTGSNKYAGSSNNGNQSGYFTIIDLTTLGSTLTGNLTLKFDFLNNTAAPRNFGYEIQVITTNADGQINRGSPFNVFGGRTGYSFAGSAPVQVKTGTLSAPANTTSLTSTGTLAIPYGNVAQWTDPGFPKNFTFGGSGQFSANIAGYANISAIIVGITWDSSGSVGQNVGIDNVSLSYLTGSSSLAPSITTPPASQTVDAGTTATFSVTANANGGTLAYTWRRGTTVIGTNSPTLTLSNVQPADAGDYTVLVANSSGSVTSLPATLIVSNALTPFETWTAAQAWPDPITASNLPTADPDADGFNNLLEYALDSNPLGPSPAPVLQQSITPTPALQLTFLRARPELTYEVQASTDLIDWPTIATNPGSVSTTTPVTFTDPSPISGKRFLRLRVSTP